MVQVREVVRPRGRFLVPVVDLWVARGSARRGGRDAGISVMRQAVNELHQEGQLFYGVWGSGVLAETLLDRGGEGDPTEVHETIDRLGNFPADDASATRDIWVLRLRALLARARANETAYGDYRDRYRPVAKSLKFDGHIAWVDAMS